MLNPEIAQARLKEYQVTDWQPVRLAKLAKLPAKLRSIGYGILAHDVAGTPVKIDYYNQSPIIEDNIKNLNGLKPADRSKIFEILFPQFAPVVEAAWRSFETSWTYQEGYNRKSFRVPGATSSKQRSWLQSLINLVRNYEPDLPWLASWCPYLGYYTDSLGYLFAAAINIDDAIGKEVFEILIASAKGEHEIGAMGRHVVRSILLANLPEGWKFVEKLLIAAQRQEGLRQSILESIDEAHPIAFQRMLKLILDENLIRFAATLRAVDVWFGFDLDVLQEKQARAIVAQVLEFLTDPNQQQAGLVSADAQTVYLALWSIGFTNAMTAIESAKVLLQHPEASHRFVAVHFLRQLKLTPALLVIITAIEDPDDRVAWLALRSISAPGELVAALPDTFDRIVALLPRWTPKPKELPKLVWDWIVLTASQEQLVGIFLYWLGKRSPKLMIPYLGICGADNRGSIVVSLAKVKPIDAEIRKALLNLTGDASSFIRQQVMFALEKCEIESDEANHLIGLLTRKSSDLRQGILGLLIKQPDLNAIDSAQKLLAAKDILQRQAGLELLAELVKVDRSTDECQSIAQSYQAKKGDKLTNPEVQLLDRISVREAQPATLRDALGLVNLTDLYAPKPVTCKNPVELNTAAAKSTLLAIDELIHKHSQTPVQIKDYSGETTEYLFGNLAWQFPSIDPNLSRDENLARLLLADVWENWYAGKRVKDKDGLELIRAAAPRYQTNNERYKSDEPETELHDKTSAYYQMRNVFYTSFGSFNLDLRYPDLVTGVINWLIYLHEQPQKVDFSLNLLATVLSSLDPTELAQKIATVPIAQQGNFWDVEFFVDAVKEFCQLSGETTKVDFQRRWEMISWMDVSIWHRLTRWGRAISLEDVSIAHHHKLATLADIIYYLIGDRFGQDIPDSPTIIEAIRTDFPDLRCLTSKKPYGAYGVTYPPAIEAAKLCRDRILEIECQRGDLPTAATTAALCIGAVEGIPTVVKLLQALETAGLKRTSGWGDKGKGATISHLMQYSFPLIGETPVEFARQVRAAKISDEKLIQFAFFAPQWVNYIQHSIDIPGFADGVWWIQAHTKDSSVPADARDVYIAQIGERTPLSEESLRDGAVDVEWFQRAYATLGAANWKRFDGAAQYACSGAGHQRAKQFASAMLGELDRKELIDRVVKKRHQDSVRALGLCPLDSGKQRELDILARYKTYQEFSRTSKQFGSQRRASEKLCVEIGMENLARTAGFADPQRLQWAMEAVEIADLVIEPQVVLIDDTTVKLRISVQGKPEIIIEKAGKSLKAIPAKLKKNPDVEALLDRKQDIVKQASRMRISLEQAMDRGDAFTSAELHQLAQHPVLAPMLRQLVLIADTPNPDIGYLNPNGTELVNPHGTIQISATKLRIAHPHDLLLTKEWHLWQQECFTSERQQPFKQVFRELYVVTTGEQTKTGSKRYEGHQVNPRQAIALFGQRGWLSSLGEGVRRTFHQAGIIATVSFANGYYTPMDVEGLTIDRLNFYKRDDSKSIPLADIPPRIFSEVMRDLDLVVSVAHIGGVDPEASASTVEMRSSILRETCRLMKLNNIQIQGSHALITGEIGTYSVHLGSAIVHRQPGGALCILPVSSQHRGRLFLPFVDDDPKTAEIMSKVLLLAKDKEIQDPTILEQILA
jgi:HEAT repeat protein